MFAVLFERSKNWKEPECASTGEGKTTEQPHHGQLPTGSTVRRTQKVMHQEATGERVPTPWSIPMAP